MALLFDLEALSARQTDEVLHAIFCKAHGHEDGDGIWEPHDNPFLARIVELFTRRGLDRIAGVREELEGWLTGRLHAPGALLPRPPAGDRVVWDDRTRGAVRLYLRSLPPGEWTLDDHMLMVDWLQQRYLSPDDMRTEAQWLADRASIMGRVQASMAGATAAQVDRMLAAVPPVDPLEVWTWAPVQRKVAQFARARSAAAVTRVSDGMRAALRQTIAQEVEQAELTGRPVWSSRLQTRLQDDFAIQNRDWRRVALTESAEAMNQGFVAAQAPGQRLKRVEQYRGVCAWCAKIDGRVVEVVDPAEPEKDGETQVWVGKTNVGRSASARKRVGDLLVEREPEERYWIAAGSQHPNCRGRWVPVITDQPGDDTDFGDWLRETLQGAGAARA